MSSLDATSLVLELTAGSPGATDRLLALAYEELRSQAERLLRSERPDHTLQATELVHEAYLRMVDQTRCRWQDRAHFLAVASQAMRRILVDHARRRGAAKRGSGQRKLSLDEALMVGTDEGATVMLALDEALERFARQYPDAARVVEIRFFGGLTIEEAACALGLSERSVSRHWEFAQAWLYRELNADAGNGSAG